MRELASSETCLVAGGQFNFYSFGDNGCLDEVALNVVSVIGLAGTVSSIFTGVGALMFGAAAIGWASSAVQAQSCGPQVYTMVDEYGCHRVTS